MDDLRLAEPRAGEVRVAVHHSGICHSDLSMISYGHLVPAVLGHEAAGVVNAVGAGVDHLKPGDKVLLSPLAPCGHCRGCALRQSGRCDHAHSLFTGTRQDGTTPFSRAGEPVYRGLGVGAFATQTVVPASGAIRLDEDVSLEVACLIGCAVQTGVGAVFNTAQLERGATVMVTGLGGVGLSVVQGARIAGAASIIASDPVAERRDMAARLGATDVAASEEELRQAVHDITGSRGVDYAFEAAGVTDLIALGLELTGVGGTVVIVGAPPVTDTLTIGSALMLMTLQKRLMGTLLGGCWPDRDIPLLIGLWRRGDLDLEAMITQRVSLADINIGIDDLSSAHGIRTVVDLTS